MSTLRKMKRVKKKGWQKCVYKGNCDIKKHGGVENMISNINSIFTFVMHLDMAYVSFSISGMTS
uniref:Uncharacterized protein n=1 Tax=Daphnia magna TaxID=35525 RepID=A0A0P6C6C2_9CRUS